MVFDSKKCIDEIGVCASAIMDLIHSPHSTAYEIEKCVNKWMQSINLSLKALETNKYFEKIKYLQGSIARLNTENEFDFMQPDKKDDDLPPCIPRMKVSLPNIDSGSEAIVKELGSKKTSEINFKEFDTSLYADICAYCDGRQDSVNDERFLIVLSWELSLFSALYLFDIDTGYDGKKKLMTRFEDPKFNKARETVWLDESSLTKGDTELYEVLRFLGFIKKKNGGGYQPSARFCSLKKAITDSNCSAYLKKIYETENNKSTVDDIVNNFIDRSIAFINEIECCIHKLASTSSSSCPNFNDNIRSHIDKIFEFFTFDIGKVYRKKGTGEQSRFKIAPRCCLEGEMEVKSYDVKDRHLLFYPLATHYNENGQREVSRYFIGTFRPYESDSLFSASCLIKHIIDEKLLDLVRTLSDLFVGIEESRVRIQLKKRKKKEKNYATRSAIAAIMSRNESHNIGSHVIYNVANNIDEIQVQKNKYFFKYIQGRFDFISQISTDWVPDWTSSSWFVQDVLKGFCHQELLCAYIAKADGLPPASGGENKTIATYVINNGGANGREMIVLQVRLGEREHLNGNGDADDNDDITRKDIQVAIPGGDVGYHAFYSIIENFIRNAAKHEFSKLDEAYKKIKQMKVNIQYEDNPDDGKVSVIISDNLSYASTAAYDPSSNEKDGKADVFYPCLDLLESGLEKNAIEKIRKSVPPSHKNGAHSPDKIFYFALTDTENHSFEIKELPIKKDNGIYSSSEWKTLLKNVKVAENTTIFSIIHPYEFDANGLCRPVCLKNFENFMGLANVRFISEPRWVGFAKTIIETTFCKQLIDFLKDIWKPAYLFLNDELRRGIFDDHGALVRKNWGLAEMKICAAYLRKKSLDIIGDSGSQIVNDVFKAVFVPEYADPKKISSGTRAYRLGYAFELIKPREILITGVSDLSEEIKQGLEKHSIFIEGSYTDVSDFDYELVVILGMDSDKFISGLKKEVKDNDVLHAPILDRMPYRLIVALDPSNECNTFVSEGLKRRLLCIQQDDISQALKAPLNGGDIDGSKKIEAFKIDLFKRWACFLAGGCGSESTVGKINLKVHNMDGQDSDKSKSNSSLIDGFFKAFSSIVSDYVIKKYPADVQEQNKLGEKIKNFLVQNEETIKIQARKNLGFNNSLYVPDVGKTFDNTGANNHAPYDEQIECLAAGNSLKTISYQRHTPESQLFTFGNDIVYDEQFGGSSAHYHVFEYFLSADRTSYNFEKAMWKLIENGFIRIAVADERYWGNVTVDIYMRDSLARCGVYPVGEILGKPIDGTPPPPYSFQINFTGGTVGIMRLDNGDNRYDTFFNCIIIHQGLLDKIQWQATPLNQEKNPEYGFIQKLKEKIPLVVITSGRGEPLKSYDPMKFLAFSTMEKYVISKPHSKLTLSGILQKLISKKAETRKNDG